MALNPIFGHETLRNRLAGAIASSRFPQATLFVGESGIGKQRLALWVGQTLLCENATPEGPCGRCSSCHRVLELSHPDVHWFIPISRPKASEPSKQIEEADGLLAEAVAGRRERPLYQRPDGTSSHSLPSIRLLQRRVALTPALGQKKVVIIGDAERLVVQEASPEAANALLKVLEEPPPDTVVMLTAADPQALLPTIRSRLVPIRVRRLSDETVAGFLGRYLRPAPSAEALERQVLLAEGSIGRALWMTGDTDSAAAAADRFLAAIKGGPHRWALAALAQAPWAARGDFTAMLDAVALKLRSRIPDAPRERARGLVRALGKVESVRWDAQGNLNPQLALAVLALELRELA